MTTDYSQKSFHARTGTNDNSVPSNASSKTATATSIDSTLANQTVPTTSTQATQSASSTISSSPLPAVTTPKSGGAISSIGEKFTTEPSTGTANLTIPLATTQINSRGAMVPSLSLSYNSGSGNGIFGYGWGLSLNEITRKTDLGLPQYF